MSVPEHDEGRRAHSSGTMARFESVTDRLENISRQLEQMDLRSRESEVRTRESLVELRGSVAHLRDLLDAMAKEHASLRQEFEKHELRIEKLEQHEAVRVALDERLDKLESQPRRNVAVTAGSGLVGGGALYGIIELVHRMVG